MSTQAFYKSLGRISLLPALASAVFLVAISNAMARTPSGPVPSSFFGMTIMESNEWPSIPFGALGKGPGTAWPYVEETKGTFNWTQLDAYVAQANAHGVSFVYTSVFVPSWAAADSPVANLTTPTAPLFAPARLPTLRTGQTL